VKANRVRTPRRPAAVAGREARFGRVRLLTSPVSGGGGPRRTFFVIEGKAKERGPAAGGSEPIRWNKVRIARARAAAGFYDRPDVRERVVEALLRELDPD